MAAAVKLKKMGLRAGAPDNLIVYGGSSYFFELKSRYGSLKDSQKEVIPKIEKAGCPVAIARTLEDIEWYLTSWGIPLNVTVGQFRICLKNPPTRMTSAEFQKLSSSSRRKT